MKKTREQLELKIKERNEKNDRDQKLIKSMKPADGWYLTMINDDWMGFMRNGKFIIVLTGNELLINSNDRYNHLSDTLTTSEKSTERLTKLVNYCNYYRIDFGSKVVADVETTKRIEDFLNSES